VTTPIRLEQHDWKRGGALQVPADVPPGKKPLRAWTCKKCGWVTVGNSQPSRNKTAEVATNGVDGNITCDEIVARRVMES
jgi:hypothetical protein